MRLMKRMSYESITNFSLQESSNVYELGAFTPRLSFPSISWLPPAPIFHRPYFIDRAYLAALCSVEQFSSPTKDGYQFPLKCRGFVLLSHRGQFVSKTPRLTYSWPPCPML